MEISIEDLIFSFDLKIQIGRQCVLLMPIKLTEYEISRLYKMAFGKEIEHPEDLSEKEGDLLEDYICIYISSYFILHSILFFIKNIIYIIFFS